MASKLSRLARIGTLTTRVSGSYLGQRVAGLFQSDEERKDALHRTHLENAERIAANLGALKGAAMKLGQAVAQVADGFELPEDARRVLGKLHDKAEPVPFAGVKTRIEAELGAGVEGLFRSIDPTPLGTASLGQAHAATLPDGTSVVVKVLHDGVEDCVQSDLGALKTMLTAGRVMRRSREEIDAWFEEIEARLAEELDYVQEAAHLQEFRSYFEGDPDVAIPRVFEGWSSRRVLTMERLSGRPVSVFAATASAAAKQRAGEALGRNFMRMVYVHRAIHADPHPGNYLFAPDGRVGMIDFGCVRRFDLDWIVNYGTCGFGTRHGDKERVMQAALQIGALTERDADAEDALWALCRAIGVPFRGGPFTLGGENDDSQAQITHAMRRVIPSGRLRAPRELIYLHRGLGGTYAIARQLRPTADWGAIFEAAWGRAVADRHAMRPAGEAVGASPGP